MLRLKTGGVHLERSEGVLELKKWLGVCKEGVWSRRTLPCGPIGGPAAGAGRPTCLLGQPGASRLWLQHTAYRANWP